MTHIAIVEPLDGKCSTWMLVISDEQSYKCQSSEGVQKADIKQSEA